MCRLWCVVQLTKRALMFILQKNPIPEKEKMQPKTQAMNLLQKSIFTTNSNGIIRVLLSKHLCTIPERPDSPESPDLPTWLFDTKSSKPTDSDGDDFVIPPLASWVVESKTIESYRNDTLRLLSEAEDCDIDRLSGILLKHYKHNGNVAEALSKSGVNPTNDLVMQLLKRFSSHWAAAFDVFTWAKNQTGFVHEPGSYNAMVDILGRCKKFSMMWELVEEMNSLDGYVSLATMTKIIRRLGRAGKFAEAVEAFRGMEEKFDVRKDATSLCVVMDALVKGNSVENAHAVFVEFKDQVTLNVNVFNVLVHGYCKARMLDDARKIMDEMERCRIRPDVVSYTCFIEAYCRERDFLNVRAILDEMKEKGCKPNVVTYTIVSHGYGKAKEISAALEMYKVMKAEGCVLDAKFYSSFIYILSQTGRLKDAWDVFEDMEKQGVKRELCTYNTMIGASCAYSQDESVLKLLKRMEKDSCKPNVMSYAPLLKLCCRKKSMKMLKFLLDHMFENDVSVDVGTYALLVKGLCHNGKLKHACFFFHEMVSKGMVPYDSTYKVLMAELERNKMIEMREKVEKLMQNVQMKTAV